MEKITVEQIDAVRKRANVGYKEAKEVLEKFDGDIVSALLYLEEEDKTVSEFKRETDKYYRKGKSVIKKLNTTRLKIKKDERISLDISSMLALIITLLAPHISLLVLVLSLFYGYKIRFEKELEFDLTKK